MYKHRLLPERNLPKSDRVGVRHVIALKVLGTSQSYNTRLQRRLREHEPLHDARARRKLQHRECRRPLAAIVVVVPLEVKLLHRETAGFRGCGLGRKKFVEPSNSKVPK